VPETDKGAPKGALIFIKALARPSYTRLDRLDDFEGPDYVRTLVPVEINGVIRVCNIYEGKPRK
jgi:hypothetical protein